MDIPDDQQRDVLGEHLSAKLDAIHELVQDVPEIKTDVKALKEDMTQVKADLALVKDAVREHIADKSLHN